MANFFATLYLFLICGVVSFAFDRTKTLKSISVIFRHGDRTPQEFPKGFYPTDPYKDNGFLPMGSGGLTNDGKRREHQIGTSLRGRYDKFLGDTYLQSELSVISTDTERTKMSLLLVLAGLFPPKKNQIWKDSIDWQPIPINSLQQEIGSFSKPSTCPTYQKEVERAKNLEVYKKDVSRFAELMKNLTILTGRVVDNTKIIYHLYHTLTAEKAMNLTLPKWTEPYFPNGLIINATLFEYNSASYTPELKKLNGGLFLRKVLNDLAIAKESESKKKRKVHLYSVHESNVAAVLIALKLWKNVIPEYSSAVVFEHHEKDGKHFLKVLYYKGIPPQFESQVIPGCTEYCPIEDFLTLVGDVLPDDIMEACFGPVSNSLLIPKFQDAIAWIYNKFRKWWSL